ncbi:uncharacterized mitochondrial protein AtMg00810-like [Andrographis paniculata]|uniref:uncharacterized mitochondrial protein AtMg00810-like n=1 Tax=Andrographis paniculata TaxID=175694 RepID=UPI0021E8DC9E|nr:uncharacterized mitochondrial protein AtMg00810-like [Andrographis paniculata]
MARKYEMSDMGFLRHFLGMEIHQEEEKVVICQRNYAEKILKFKMLGCNLVSTPSTMGEKLKQDDGGKPVDETHYRSLIGNLLYLTATRPDIMFVTSLLTQLMQKPSQINFGAAKRVLCYIQGTMDFGLSYKKSIDVKFIAYCDSDFGGSLDDSKSALGYCFRMGSAVFTWISKKQQSVAQSSSEVEYLSATLATSQAIWLRRVMGDLRHEQQEGTMLYCDNKSAIFMAKNPTHHNSIQSINVSDMKSDILDLNGDNYKVWNERIILHLGWMDIDYAIKKDEPPPITENSTPDEVDLYEKWERSNRLCVMFIKTRISAGIRGSVSIVLMSVPF